MRDLDALRRKASAHGTHVGAYGGAARASAAVDEDAPGLPAAGAGAANCSAFR